MVAHRVEALHIEPMRTRRERRACHKHLIAVISCRRAVDGGGAVCDHLQTRVFSQLSLCLVRACLGRSSVLFSHQVVQKMFSFLTTTASWRQVHRDRAARLCSAQWGHFLSFPYVCPEPVLVKSAFIYKNGQKVLLPACASGTVLFQNECRQNK